MKHTLFTCLLAAGCCLPVLQANARVGDLLPQPHVVTVNAGAQPFLLGREVALTDETDCLVLKNFLTSNGCTISEGAAAKVVVQMVDAIDGAYDYVLPAFDNESYSLEVTDNQILIKAVTKTGVIRAAQTLAQLAEGYDDEGQTAQVEALNITDWPAFKLRGWMQDVGRSFLSFDELKKEIDLLSRFKVNVFHWHMTEKLAWRFEVKAYPQLTQAENMIRYPGQYYTQDQCRELEAYAAERGITVIPEIDMPGHSDVFTKTMGFDMQSDQGKAALKVILKEVSETFTKAPYIHIGGDEVAIQDGFLEEMSGYVRNTLDRKVVLWNKLMNKAVTSDIADMTQMWATSGTAVKGLPNIDCRYNYTNHFDVYADLVGIYKSNIYYAQQGNADLAGTISAAWNDTKVPTEEDIIKQNNQYANILASADRAWKGGGKRYIEVGGTTLPNKGEEYEEFADFERRFLFHKAHSLKNEPIPYVKQSNVHWRITDPFPNGGDASKVLPPEECTDDLLPTSFSYNGQYYDTSFATGAGIYLRHIWHPTVPSFFTSPANNQTAYAWTYVYSPIDQEVGAQIEFYTYSRSGNDYAPAAGKWDRRGSRIWLNGNEIPAPTWQQTDKNIPQDHATEGLTNENFTAREPVALHLNKGWNKVFMKLPHVNSGGTKRDKWQFTFVITDTEGRNALDGLIYSPDKSMTDSIPDEDKSPKKSTDKETFWYEMNTPKRNNLYPTSKGIGQDIVGESTSTQASQWKFQSRTDGTFDIINRADSSYISPNSANNTALKTVKEQPATGWTFTPAATDGLYIITNGTVQFNQTNNSTLGFKVYNWGGGNNTTDTGCQYAFKLVEFVTNDPTTPDEPATDKRPKMSNATESNWYRMNSKRFPTYYPTTQGDGQAIVSQNGESTQASEWKFVDRGDGTFDIVNRADGIYISPVAEANTALSATTTAPATGWELKPADTDGYFILVNGTTEINQTKSSQGYKLYNWGYGTQTAGQFRTDDEGCQFIFNLTETEKVVNAINAVNANDASIQVIYGRIVTNLPYRLYSIDGRSLPIGRRLAAGTYVARTAQGNVKVVVK